jgi:hypothetical protein
MTGILLLLLQLLFSCKASASDVYTLQKGDLSLSISAERGGRIVSIKRGGHELLLSEAVHPKYYGAVLWVSPQRRFWPPSPILDSAPYHVEKTHNTLRLTSEKDTITGLRFIKEFSISEQDTTIVINYQIENISDSAQHVAAWDVTRVPAGGRVFFPVKDRVLPNLTSDLPVSEEDSLLCYTYSDEPVKKGQKLFATTQEGWLAYQNNQLLFIKTFPTVDVEDLPPLQGEVEIFLAPNSLYIELENHGAYTRLEKGESLTYRQKWKLLSLPENAIPDKKERP